MSRVEEKRTMESGRSTVDVSLRVICLLGSAMALLLCLSFNINVHQSASSPQDQSIKFVVDLSVRKNVVTDLLFNINFSDPNLSEEDIVNDPLTHRLLDNALDEGDEAQVSASALAQEASDMPQESYSGPVRVALYVGSGTTTNARNNIPKVLEQCSNGGIKVFRIGDASLSNVGRRRHDVIFIPGGSAGKIYAEMSSKAKKKKVLAPRKKIQTFLSKGGGYVGICAGAYLAAGGKSGRSPLKLSLFQTESGMLGDGYVSSTYLDPSVEHSDTLAAKLSNNLLKDSKLFYANGPIFKNSTAPPTKELRNPQPILRMGSQAELRILIGTSRGKQTHRRHRGLPLVVMNNFNSGRVVLSTAHPETDVHHLTYDHWSRAHKPSDCASAEAQMLLSMVYLAANRNPHSSGNLRSTN